MSVKINKVLVVDCETSGINKLSKDISDKYQSLSWGLIVADVNTFKTIDEMYIEIKWDGKSFWDNAAQAIHGLSKEYLDEHGEYPLVAAGEIGEFILKHWDIGHPLNLMGHNPHFDLCFLRKLLHENELPFKFAHRHFDSFSLGAGTIKEFSSDDIFEALNIKRNKSKHNALEDARAVLEVFRKINRIWDKAIND